MEPTLGVTSVTLKPTLNLGAPVVSANPLPGTSTKTVCSPWTFLGILQVISVSVQLRTSQSASPILTFPHLPTPNEVPVRLSSPPPSGEPEVGEREEREGVLAAS